MSKSPSRVSPGPRRSAAGFTLLELLVVLTILAIVAALMIPLFPNFLRRANKATDATQMAELSKAIQTYQAEYFEYPRDFDLLVDGSGAFPTYMPSTSNGAYDQIVISSTLDSNQAKALNKVGITRLQPLNGAATSGNQTLNPYLTASPDNDGIPVDSNMKVAILNTAAILATPPTKKVNADLYNVLASDTGLVNNRTPTYLIVGVGARNTAVGRTMVNAPVAMPQGPDMNPAKNYCRYGAIFKIDGDEIALTKRARFITVVSMEEDELETIDNETVGYIKVVEGEKASAPVVTGSGS